MCHDVGSMTWTGPGFVDHHAHLLRAAGLGTEDWGNTAQVRALHERCAERGATPLDLIEPPVHTDLERRLLEAMQRAARVGLVEIWEAGTRHGSYWEALLALRERGTLPLRVRVLVAVGLAEQGMPARTGDAWCDVIGVKLYADGWLGPRTCAVSTHFHDQAANEGLLFESADHLARRIEPFAAAGWLIATHAIGDRAIESVLDAYERVYGGDCHAAAPRIEHAQLLRRDLVSRMADLGVVACIQPGFAVDDEEQAHAGLGEDWPLAYRWSALLAAGVPVITGSDFPIDRLEPLSGLAKLMSNPFDALSRLDALRLMTNGAAGTVALSTDPATVDAGSIVDIEVLAANPAG
jgi:predicted amidohydrolase YtcJ